MQLDPQMKALLDQVAAAGGKPFHAGTPQEARAGINALISLVVSPACTVWSPKESSPQPLRSAWLVPEV